MNFLFLIFIVLAAHHCVSESPIDDIQDFIGGLSKNNALLNSKLQKEIKRVDNFNGNYILHIVNSTRIQYEALLPIAGQSHIDVGPCLKTFEQFVNKSKEIKLRAENCVNERKVHEIRNSLDVMMNKAIELKNEIKNGNLWNSMKSWISIPRIREEGERVINNAGFAIQQIGKCIDGTTKENIVGALSNQSYDVGSTVKTCIENLINKTSHTPESSTSNTPSEPSSTPNYSEPTGDTSTPEPDDEDDEPDECIEDDEEEDLEEEDESDNRE